jgi:dTMP kinase
MTDALRSGLFLTFEGMDGSGKSTQMRLLINRLRQEGYDVLETAEPGGTPIGLQIRRILLDPANAALSSRAELLLYFASRAQNVDELIRPALAAGKIIVSDRFTDSTLAYQAGARGLGDDVVRYLHAFACREVNPDLTLFLDIDRATGLARAHARNAQLAAAAAPDESRIDAEADAFHDSVHAAYRRLIDAEPHRIKPIDAAQSIDAVSAAIWNAVFPLLAQRSLQSDAR